MSLATQISSAITAIGTQIKADRATMGTLSSLTTTAKTSLVAAINEVKAQANAATPAAASSTVAGVVQLATDAETLAGTITGKATTPANVKAALAALTGIAPTTLDTLVEIDTAIGNDPNFATTTTTALAGKQPIDPDLTAIAALVSAADKLPYATGAGAWSLTTLTAFARSLLDDTDAATMQATLGVYSQAQIGDPATDFVAVLNAALA